MLFGLLLIRWSFKNFLFSVMAFGTPLNHSSVRLVVDDNNTSSALWTETPGMLFVFMARHRPPPFK